MATVLGATTALAIVLALASCTSEGRPAASPPTTVAVSPPKPRCLLDDAKATVVMTGDIQIVLFGGTGDRGVVLAPQRGEDACQWADDAQLLVRRGYRVASYTWSADELADLPAAVQALAASGAKKIALVGASAGGGVVLNQAAGLTPPVVGVVGVSPVDVYGGDPGLAAWRGPLLLLTGDKDTEPTPADVRADAAAHRGRDKVVLYPGSEHGVDLVAAHPGARKEINVFLAKVLGRRIGS
jgi:dienelactone hydrolase